MTLQLQWRGGATVPVEVEGVTPDQVVDKSLDEIRRLPIFEGKRAIELAEFFDVSGDPSDGQLVWQGDLRGVHWLGTKMSFGDVRVEGDVGRHVGSEMSGGTIHVSGSVGDWVGAEMRGGRIRIQGDAGHQPGAAYRGSARGMTGGTIEIFGRAGNEVGHTMRRGLIAIGGSVGDLAAFNMLAGTVLMFGEVGIRHGAGMRRGTLAYFAATPHLLPTFRHACRFQPLAIHLVTRQLAANGYTPAAQYHDPHFELYNGDMIEGGRGEVLVLSP